MTICDKVKKPIYVVTFSEFDVELLEMQSLNVNSFI